MNFRRKTGWLLLCALSISSRVRAQYYNEEPLPMRGLSIGVKAGLSDLWGDVGTKSVGTHYFNGQYFSSTHYMGGVIARYSITRWLAARIEANGGTIYSTDSWNRKVASSEGPGAPEYNIYHRNQDAKTTILEGLFNVEVMPLRFLQRGCRVSRMPLQPVLLAGLGVFHFNPKTTYIDPSSGSTRWVETQPLHLEGEGMNYPGAPAGYKTTQVCIPVGIGVRYEATSRLAIGFEYLLRITTTDYLDGVSGRYVDPAIFSQYLGEGDAAIARQVYNKSGQLDPTITHPPGDIRGNPDNKDAYSILGFHITWRLLSQRDRL